jgi:hypothetical protein
VDEAVSGLAVRLSDSDHDLIPVIVKQVEIDTPATESQWAGIRSENNRSARCAGAGDGAF